MAFETQIKNCTGVGDKAEDIFKLTMKKYGYECIDANSYENRIEHWDVKLVDKQKQCIKVDVKAEKKKNRHDTENDNEVIWIEFKNIYGYDGWLYGKADYIAFQNNNKFLLVYRKKLEKLCEKLTGYTKTGINKIEENNKNYSEKKLYAFYSREGRQDIICIIKKKDIEKIISKEFVI